MVSAETLLIYPDYKLPFTVHTDASDKQLGDVIIQNNKHIALSSIRLIKPQCNYTKTQGELLTIVACLQQFRGILFGYEINVFLYHKNLFLITTLNKYQRAVKW